MNLEVVEVRFKKEGKGYYFSSNIKNLDLGINVIVETEKGLQYGEVINKKGDVRDFNGSKKLKKVIRKATKKDYEKNNANAKKAKKAFLKCEELIKKYNLKMTLIDSIYTFDCKQVLFTFVSEERIDFRELVKELASIYHCRIEMRQIGIRDKAKKIGGIGPCGRVLCCKNQLKSFDTVSIKMAKNQNLALNPSKINGVCGRLMCCLRYEEEFYRSEKKKYKKVGSKIKITQGEGKILSIDVFNETYKILVKGKGLFDINKEEIDGSN